MLKPEERLLYVIFCDQARTEDTRKGLYIGVYGGTLIVEGDFPAFLASLSIAVCVRPVSTEEKIRVSIQLPGEPNPHDFDKVHSASHPDDSIVWIINIAPFVCVKPGKVRVHVAFHDGSKIEKSLRVMSRSEYKETSLLWPSTTGS